MSIITRYGGAGIVPTSFNVVDKLRAEWRMVNGVLVSGGVDSVPDTSGYGQALLLKGTTRPARSGNVVTLGNNRHLYVPSLSLPADCKDIMLIFVCKFSSAGGSGWQFLAELGAPSDASLSGAQASKTATYLESRIFGNVGAGIYRTSSAPVVDTWVTIAYVYHKSTITDALKMYVNGALVSGGYAGNANNTNGFASGEPLTLGARHNGTYYISADVTAVRLYAGYMSPTEIAAASAEIYAQNTPSP